MVSYDRDDAAGTIGGDPSQRPTLEITYADPGP
jgi:hypothetical protein